MAGRAKQLGPSTTLGRYLDGLLQSFEDRRPGLPSATLQAGDAAVQQFFADVYQAEHDRLAVALAEHAPHLSVEAREKFYEETDRLVRKTVIPAYVRITGKFTPRERNDFYLVPEGMHALERIGWSIVGMILGVFILWAPFIPIWSKEWMIVFMVGGLLFPNIRKAYFLKNYESALNDLVVGSERELERIDRAYLDSGEVIPELKELIETSAEELAKREREAAKHEAAQEMARELAAAKARAAEEVAKEADAASDDADRARAQQAESAKKEGN